MKRKTYNKLSEEYKEFKAFQKFKKYKSVRGEAGYVQIEMEVYKKSYIDRVMKEWQRDYLIN